MHNIIYSIFYAGALTGVVLFYIIEPMAALVGTLLLPPLVLYLAERFGYVEFSFYEEPEPSHPLIAKMIELGLDDETAYSKYGHAIVNEFESIVDETQRNWKDAVEARDEFIENIKGIKA
jgi:hypothetical protein